MGESPASTTSQAQVEERLSRLDSTLQRLEETSGPLAELALEAVQELTAVYGEALARVLVRVRESGDVASLERDPLVGQLMVLHGLHRVSVEERVAAALDDVQPYIRSHGGAITLLGIEGDVARVELHGSCDGCSASKTTLERLVSDAVLAAAPELARVEAVDATPAPATSGPVPITLVPLHAVPS